MDCIKKWCEESNASYDRPLCYACWLEFDEGWLDECEVCGYFFEIVELSPFDESRGFVDGGEVSNDGLRQPEGQICWDCYQHEMNGRPIYRAPRHLTLERERRYVYILELDNGNYYIGQTYELESRLAQHKQGKTSSTKGLNPELVYFEDLIGKSNALEREQEVTILNATESGKREILNMIIDWQREYRLLKFIN